MFRFLDVRYGAWEVFLSGLASAFLFLFGDLRFTMLMIVIISLFDLVTGIIQSFVRGTFESKVLLKTAWKVLGYAILISMLHLLFIVYLPGCEVPGKPGMSILPVTVTEPLKIFPFIIAILIMFREGASIIENLVKAKILPRGLANRIGRVFKSVRETLEADKPQEPPG